MLLSESIEIMLGSTIFIFSSGEDIPLCIILTLVTSVLAFGTNVT